MDNRTEIRDFLATRRGRILASWAATLEQEQRTSAGPKQGG